MSKISISDYVYAENHRTNGTVITDRGGHVGRYGIKLDSGDFIYASSRDLTVIKPGLKQTDRLTNSEKIDLLLEHLGLEIKDEPSIVRIVKHEKKSHKKH